MFRIFSRPLPKLRASSTIVNLAAAAVLTCCANAPFWRELARRIDLASTGNWFFAGTVAISLFLLFNALFSIVSFRPVHKPLLVLTFLIAATVSYYMSSYGIVIDRQMITNLLETDISEASEQLTWPLFRHLALLGVIPSLALLFTSISYRPWRRELMVRGGIILGSSALLVLLILANFKDVTLFGRENRALRMYVNPTYPVYSLIKTVRENRRARRDQPLEVIAADARRTVDAPRTAIVLVVGETARAEEFSLNGYSRNTNPQLSSRQIFNFDDVQSCGTDTAESLPCMFSHLGKGRYSRSEAKRYENLLDVLKRAGVEVVWRDNNSGSKGVGDRVAYENLAQENDRELCSSGECFDEILLKDLGKHLDRNSGTMLIVLHQKGSHGPSYYKRTPKEFEKFMPVCTQDNVQDCNRQSIINAYDNTIVYTDYVLAKLIDLLQAQRYATAMLYVSDHGESLGENNIYLHGLPYAIAPEQQTHIPMIFWASEQFLREKNLAPDLLAQHEHDKVTHDYLFHSMLGLFGIQTEIYNRGLDLFHAARASRPGTPHLAGNRVVKASGGEHRQHL